MLNDRSGFEGYKPSIERFARIIFQRVTDAMTTETVTELCVRVWADDEAAGTYDAAV